MLNTLLINKLEQGTLFEVLNDDFTDKNKLYVVILSYFIFYQIDDVLTNEVIQKRMFRGQVIIHILVM